MNDEQKRSILPVRAATLNVWREVLGGKPLLHELSCEGFAGFRIHGSDLGCGLFGEDWVVVHVQAAGAGVVVTQGPFDFPEQAVAALVAQVAGTRALHFLGDPA